MGKNELSMLKNKVQLHNWKTAMLTTVPPKLANSAFERIVTFAHIQVRSGLV